MASSLFFSLQILVSLIIFTSITVLGAPEEALITELPGFNGTLLSKHYAGYITVDETTGKKLYYYFVQSERNPAEDPVVLWLNGGPRCSSFYGFIYEHGPFKFKAGKNYTSLPDLELNPYSWAKVSNVIYLDSPSGVGLSYSNTESDYITGDKQTAVDTHIFLLKWFEKYPEFVDHTPEYISQHSMLKLQKGYLIGNGVTHTKFDYDIALVPFARGMGLISQQFFQELNTTCEGNFFSPQNQTCANNLAKFKDGLVGLNVHHVLKPCPWPVRKRMFRRAWPFRAYAITKQNPTRPKLSRKKGYKVEVQCFNDDVATAWLNYESVRNSIHALSVKELEWVLCTSKIKFHRYNESMIKHHRDFTKKGYRALIYSGDHDMRIPYTGTEAWTRSMGYKIIDEWRPWKTNGQVSGYTQGYDHNLTFLTTKGAGHSVPEFKPKEALTFYSRWLAGDAI
ncbi:putative Serine carboxypeptidase [Zostera marina]|uniref:Putative Serine carboxypeptidase n=1 Tax=Zostera marina TaxID=29655 RepID=A0A0K9PZF5_ZOSMR|nr:putative Serine carboxypeptidase [Zostera marina]